MSLRLHAHPLSSSCHKVLIALYEAETPFTQVMVNFGDPESHAAFLALWPVGKMPVLYDADRNETVAETSIIIEYLDRYHAGPQPMLPADPDVRAQARLWDRLFDLYVHDPMQRLVANHLRPKAERDARGAAEAEGRIVRTYDLIETHMEGRDWAAGNAFSIADCAAAPALFYAGIIVPFGADRHNLSAYFERLLARPSYRRALIEAQPWFQYYPYRDRMPERFLNLKG
ncbi:glutathione S-transferase family protein [Loktanella sp. DJP18]|uniref:glutathione S-transferase family protein n=1 Tax=Loktanella sp. DJP18 TaxID=3409788 RepID=UPI003BB7545C